MKNIEIIFNEWLNSDETKNKNLSEMSIKNYTRTANNLSFGILNAQSTIIKKLKENYENPNTRSSYLNMVIMLRKYKDKDIDKLIKYRNEMKNEIEKLRKEKLEVSKEVLPTLEHLDTNLEHLEGLKYLINYLFINYGFRNKDINLKYVNEIPEEKTENYIVEINKGIKLSINDYKTGKQYGEKVFFIRNPKFMKEFRKRQLKEGDYLIGKPQGGKYSISNFNDIVLKYSIDQLGETNIFKILMKDLIDKKNYKRIEELSISRGTSMDTLIRSYNVYNSI